MPTILTIALLALTQPAADAVSVTVEGKVREVSNRGTTQAMLETDDKKGLSLTSAIPGLSNELRRLSGVRIRVQGTRSSKTAPDGEPVSVTGYEILDVGKGVVPRVGTIAAIELDGKRRLIFVDSSGAAEMLPTGWVKRMAGHVGAKVWMVGRTADKVFRPSRFSILRPGQKAKNPEQKQ